MSKDKKIFAMSDKKSGKKENEEVIVDEKESNELENEQVVDNSEEVEEEQKPKEEILKEELDDYKDKYLRLYSEFENFRRRTNKEKLEMISTANEKLLAEVLPVLDDFERAEKTLEEKNDLESHVKGMDLIHQKLRSTLNTKGVKKMDALEQDFDPELHEAITQIPVDNKKMIGKVVDVIEEGYYLNEKVLRHAKVVVGKGK